MSGRTTDFLAALFRDSLDPGYADAAARRAARAGQPPSRWRHGIRLLTVLTLMVLGVLVAVAYQQVVAAEPARTAVRADLEEQVRDRTSETDQLEEHLNTLRDEVSELRDQQLGDPLRAEELRQLEAAAGLVPVTGDGAVVEVADGPPGVDPDTGAPVLVPDARILDLDLQRIVNGLWAAGAEAVAVNGRRLTVTSTVRDAGGVILVDRVPVSGPYEVAAIGPDDLADRFHSSLAGRVIQALAEKYGISYEARSARDLNLPAAAAPLLEYATLVGGD